LSFYYW